MKINVIPVAYEKFCLLMNLPRGKDERVDKYPESIRKVLMFFYTPWKLWRCICVFFQALKRKHGKYDSYKMAVIDWKYTEAYLKEREWIT
jgi:hypothetical protein